MVERKKVWVVIPEDDRTAVAMMERWREGSSSKLSIEEFTTRYRARFNCSPEVMEEAQVGRLAAIGIMSCFFYPVAEGFVGLPTKTPSIS